MKNDDGIDRPGEREAAEQAEARMATTVQSIRILLLGGVALLGLLGVPVLLAVLVQ